MTKVELVIWAYTATPDEPPDPDRVANIDIDNSPARLRGTGLPLVNVGLGPLMDGADELTLDLLIHEEVAPRIGRFLEGADDAPWTQVSTGHWQLTLIERWLPDLATTSPPERTD